MMACETERNPLGVFKCQLCALTAPYSYKGQQPPDSQSVVLLEESYVLRDPFTPDKGRFLVVGSRCSMCSRLVCVGPVGLTQPVPWPAGSGPGSFAPTALLEAHWLFFS
ncbi:cysteine-rich DPF motif domain-containing protein 1 isoform X4 [Cervus canadensis]|uniref:cysteine-rich DPF motif domain-containing protein 1 isoform X4 n=1 Tax=Cervus canadensis TaxID=1574408 RepID=UPI001CA317CC|nr:cysteine-rich DPF motif domain-containing protein 1 isoform X4 [Cervus canadensis]